MEALFRAHSEAQRIAAELLTEAQRYALYERPDVTPEGAAEPDRADSKAKAGRYRHASAAMEGRALALFYAGQLEAVRDGLGDDRVDCGGAFTLHFEPALWRFAPRPVEANSSAIYERRRAVWKRLRSFLASVAESLVEYGEDEAGNAARYFAADASAFRVCR